jgi:hypothetical protein
MIPNRLTILPELPGYREGLQTRKDRMNKSTSPRRKAETEELTVVIKDEAKDASVWKEAMLRVLEQYGAAWKDLFDGEVIIEDRQGKPLAVVLDYQHFTKIIEKLEDLLDAQSAREAIAAMERGEEKPIPWDQVKANLLAEGLIDE